MIIDDQHAHYARRDDAVPRRPRGRRPAGRAPRQERGHAQVDGRAAVRRRADDQPAADLLGALAHAPQPEALGAATRHEPGAVVLDRKHESLAHPKRDRNG
jgi:hypothetical protein